MKNSSVLGKIHSIDTYSTLDGFGIRSVIFMQGCDLRCIYCHNPDTWDKTKYISITSDEVVKKCKNYISYYGVTGGITFSGGEALLQADFVYDCVMKFKKLGVKSCIETSGCVELTDTICNLLKNLDYVICDLKFANDDDYKKYTCANINKVLKFLDFLDVCKIPVWIRTVVVPGINDNENSLEDYKAIVDKYHNVIKWELLPFSKLGFEKYKQLNIINRLEDIQDLDMVKFKKLQSCFEKN